MMHRKAKQTEQLRFSLPVHLIIEHFSIKTNNEAGFFIGQTNLNRKSEPPPHLRGVCCKWANARGGGVMLSNLKSNKMSKLGRKKIQLNNK